MLEKKIRFLAQVIITDTTFKWTEHVLVKCFLRKRAMIKLQYFEKTFLTFNYYLSTFYFVALS